MLSDNHVLVNNIRDVPTLFCVQRSAQKMSITEEALVASNIASFGSEVGQVTNRITSLYDVQAQYQSGTEEFETLEYRIQSGQLYQQNTIDKTKGVVCKPMPRYWYDPMALVKPDSPTKQEQHTYELNRRIVASKKPYFMRYIYPTLMKEYNTYIKKTNAKALCSFRMTVDELEAIPEAERTAEQAEFLRYYYHRMPVGINDCTVNRICRRVEAEFDGISEDLRDTGFDYRIMSCGVSYTPQQYNYASKLYESHKEKMAEIAIKAKQGITSKEAYDDYAVGLKWQFCEELFSHCSNLTLATDIVLDICYTHAGTKQFAWDVVGEGIVENLLRRSGGVMTYPILDPDGDFTYRGDTYSMATKVVDIDGTDIE